MRNKLRIVFLTMGNRKELLSKIETVTRVLEKTDLQVEIQISYNLNKSAAPAENFIGELRKGVQVCVTPEYFDSAEEHLYFVYKSFTNNAAESWFWVLSDEDPFVEANLLKLLNKLSKLESSMIFLGTVWENDGGWRSSTSSYRRGVNELTVKEKLLHVGIPYAGSKIGSFILNIDDNFFASLTFFKESLESSILFTHGFFYYHLSCLNSKNSLVWPHAISVNSPNPTDTDKSESWINWHKRHNRPFHYDWTIGQLQVLEKLHSTHMITSDDIFYATISDVQRGNLSYIWDICWRINNKVIQALLDENERFSRAELRKTFDFLTKIGFHNQKLLDAWVNALQKEKISVATRLESVKFAKFSWDFISNDPLYFLWQEPFLDHDILRIHNKYVALNNSLDAKTIVRFFYAVEGKDILIIAENIEILHAGIIEKGNFDKHVVTINERYVEKSNHRAASFENIEFKPILELPLIQIFLLKFAPKVFVTFLSKLVQRFRRM